MGSDNLCCYFLNHWHLLHSDPRPLVFTRERESTWSLSTNIYPSLINQRESTWSWSINMIIIYQLILYLQALFHPFRFWPSHYRYIICRHTLAFHTKNHLKKIAWALDSANHFYFTINIKSLKPWDHINLINFFQEICVTPDNFLVHV